MSRQTDTSLTAGPAPVARCPDIASWWDSRRAGPVSEVMDDVSRIVQSLNADPQFMRRLGRLSGTVLVLSATDTGRELMIHLEREGVVTRPYAGEPFDVKIEATEDVHWAVLSGQMDADAAFFARKVRVHGSIVKAFRLKNMFLSPLQSHLALACGASHASAEDRRREV